MPKSVRGSALIPLSSESMTEWVYTTGRPLVSGAYLVKALGIIQRLRRWACLSVTPVVAVASKCASRGEWIYRLIGGLIHGRLYRGVMI